MEMFKQITVILKALSDKLDIALIRNRGLLFYYFKF